MRKLISLNENWTLSFPKGERLEEKVTLPHTWNAVDGMDGNGSYLRTTGVYRCTFLKPEQPLEGGRVYVEVLAQICYNKNTGKNHPVKSCNKKPHGLL